MYNPYNYHVAVRDDAMFFGRKKLLSRLVNGLCAPIPSSAAIFGGRRSGKTSLLRKLRRMLEGELTAAGDRHFIPCSLDLQRGRPLKSSDDFFLWVLEELGESWEQRQGLEYGVVVEELQMRYRHAIKRGPVDAFVRAFRSLDTGQERIRLAILIDESENILTVEWGDDLRPNLRYLLSNSPVVEDIVLIMAGSTQMYTKVTERDSPLENILDRYYLTTLSHEATIGLAREPNDYRLPEASAEEVWCQTGGQACMTQYVLYELWNDFDGQLENSTEEDVIFAAQGFDDRTRHFSAWTRTLGRPSWTLYLFLLQQDAPVSYATLRSHFSEAPITALQSTLDALVYHGLVHCNGRGRNRRYNIAGTIYRDWFLTAGKLSAPEQDEDFTTPAGIQVLIEHIEQHIGAQTNTGGGAYVGRDVGVKDGSFLGRDKHTGVDQRDQQIHGPQTNIDGDVEGSMASGEFRSATTFGEGNAKDCREQEGD